MLSRWSLPIEFEQALQYANAALPADAYLFVPPDNDDAAIPTRFDRKSFLQLSLKKAYTVLSHLGALRLPDHSILFPATPEGAEELPFDPIWLKTAGLVGTSWHTNVLAAPVSVLSTSSFLTTRYRQVRARPCSPGALYPDIDATFLCSPTVLKALQLGNFAGGRELPTDQWQTALTPYHFIVSIPGQKVMALPTSGLTASQMGTLVTNMGWILHPIFSDPGLYPDLPADCSAFLLRSPLAGLLMQIRNLLAQLRLTDAWMPSAQQTQPKGFGTRPPSSITSAT
jgi:hypothetical protein